MNVKYRSHKKELLDADDIPFAHIRQNMQELQVINKWLGGHRITLDGIKKLIGERKSVSICEIGCGGGDNLKAIEAWCLKKGIHITMIGIDIKQACIDFAKVNGPQSNIAWIVNDYTLATFESKPDIIFSSLFCHHFLENEMIGQLQWMMQNANLGFFINDLHRHVVAYNFIKWMTTLFSKSYLVKHDAPLSVARAFKKNDWIRMLRMANIPQAKVNWKWAFRFLVYYRHSQ